MSLLHDSGAQVHVGELLAKHLAGANLLGRLQIVRHTHQRAGVKTGLSQLSRLESHPRLFGESDDPDAMVGYSLDLAPSDSSTDYLRGLTPVTSQVFDGLTSQYQKLAFSLAGVADQRLLASIRDELAEIFRQGGTREDFQAAVNKLTDAAGIDRLTAFTLDTAFNTAMQSAYSVGRLEQMSAPQTRNVLPIWKYFTVGDDRVRPEHRVLQGFEAQALDPVWRRIYPPSGYNCRCTVVPILASEAEDKNAMEGGIGRLPAIALLKVPQPGFRGIFNIAA